MRERGELRCLIAAGGTAGHVLPALAVAEELRARGASVTFAGAPDRVEARLVPEGGYGLDTLPISGLPRPPSPAPRRAVLRAGALASGAARRGAGPFRASGGWRRARRLRRAGGRARAERSRGRGLRRRRAGGAPPGGRAGRRGAAGARVPAGLRPPFLDGRVRRSHVRRGSCALPGRRGRPGGWRG